MHDVFEIEGIFEETLPVPFMFNGGKINMDVFISKLTPDFHKELKAATEQDEVDGLVHLISEALKGWSCVLKGISYPPTKENLGRLPLKMLTPAAEAILTVWTGNPQSEQA